MSADNRYIYEFGDFRLDSARRLLLKRDSDQPVKLTSKAFDTLLYMVRHAGAVLDKDELMRAVWPDTIVEENNLSQNVSALRRALGEKQGENRYIATVPGRGFSFVAEVRQAASKDREESADLVETYSTVEQHEMMRGVDVLPADKLKAGRRSRLWPAVIIGVIFVALGAGALYFWRARTQLVLAPPVRTIAVLPFKPLAAQERDPIYELGLAHSLIFQLSTVKEITVRSIESVRKYTDIDVEPVAAGRELGVDFVLSSYYQISGDKIRVTSWLINVHDGSSVETFKCDELCSNLFDVQDAISLKMGQQLVAKLTDEQRTLLTKRYTENAGAFELYLNGRVHMLKLTQPAVRESIRLFQQAIDIDPSYALAYAGLAQAYHSLPINSDVPPKVAFPQAKVAAAKALEIDDSLANVHASLSMIKTWYDWDWTGAELEARRAIALNPNLAEAHRAYALLLSTLGRHQEAIAEGARAREIEPRSPIIRTLESLFLYFNGQYDEAREKLTRTLEMEPNFWIALLTLARVDIRQGRYAEAIAGLSKAKSTSGGNTHTISMIGYAWALAGDRVKARAVLDELKTLSTQRYVPPCTIAMVYNGLGEDEEAVLWLERAYEERDVLLAPFIKSDPIWGRMRAKPRFAAILKRMNLE